jgi:phosphate transport system substrate-binding protein
MRHQTFTEAEHMAHDGVPRLVAARVEPCRQGERKGVRTMKRALVLGLLAVAAVAAAAFAGGTQPASARPAGGSLVGTGSTFVYPLISKWIPAVDSAYGTKITYSPTGSGTGIAQVTARTVNFGASDAPLSPDQIAACKGCVVIPWALAGTSLPYNIPGLNGRLRLDGATVANIYLGNITNWNATAIKKLNPKLNLPNLKITPVYRSDSSGTTYAFTGYLNAVSPQWKSKVGQGTAVNFPNGTGARGSSGVAGVVKSTAGAITYVDAAYSITNKFQFALLKNRAGGFATPGIRGVSAALCDVPKKVTKLSQLKIVDPPAKCGKVAYPLSTFTYVIIPTSLGDKAQTMRQFVYWAVTQGQKYGPPLFFVPLSNTVKAFAYREIAKIKS